jgi:uncharacterized protein YlxW (UPF0749 family)
MDVVTILAATAMVAIPSWFAHRNHKDLKEVVYQTKNNHDTNLRDDIDRAIRAVEQLGHDVRGIRTDLAAEEDRRRTQVAELEDRLEKFSRHQ